MSIIVLFHNRKTVNWFGPNLYYLLLLKMANYLFPNNRTSAIEKLYSLYIPTIIVKVVWSLPVIIILYILFQPLTFKKVVLH